VAGADRSTIEEVVEQLMARRARGRLEVHRTPVPDRVPNGRPANACPSCRAPPSADPTAGASSPGLTRPASDRGQPMGGGSCERAESVSGRSVAGSRLVGNALSISARERSRGRRGHFGTVSKPSWAFRSTVGSNPPPLDNRGGIFPRSQAR